MGRGYSGNHPRFSKHKDESYDAKEAYNKDLTASARLHYLENDRHDHTSPNHMSVNQRLDDSFGMGQNTNQAPSPMNKHTRSHRLREKAMNISKRSGAERGDEYDYENPRVQKLLSKANKADERSSSEYESENRQKEMDSMMDERADSPMNLHNAYHEGAGQRAMDSINANKLFFQSKRANDERSMNQLSSDDKLAQYINEEAQNDLAKEQAEKDEITRALLAQLERENKSSSPMNACAKSEGGSGCIKQMSGSWRVISNKTDKPWPAKYASKSKAEAALRGYHAG